MMLHGGRASFTGLLLVTLLVAFTAVACDGGGGATVGVDLQEWAVVPDEESVSSGEVTFEISNVGEETHEFVVLATDLEAGELPTDEDGAVDEGGGGIEVIDEVEDLAAGDSAELTVDLDAGHYVLLCNIVEEEDGEVESHYQMGMRIDFNVE